MTNVLVAVKRVPDSSSEVLLTADAQAVDGSKAGFTTSPPEECAVEIATQAVACAQPAHVGARPPPLGPADIAGELAWVVKDHGAAGRTHDLVLLGSDASDTGDFQVGIRLAYELGRPVVNGATTVTVEDGPEGRVAVAVGKGPEGPETHRVPLPAVVT